MDYFINFYLDTYGLGLNDFYLTTAYIPKDSKFNVGIDIHHFMSNTWSYVSTAQTIVQESLLGEEIDLTLKYNFIKGTAITWGGSVFIPGELMRLMFAPANDVAFWSYVMITANI